MAGLLGFDLNDPKIIQAIQLMTARQGEVGGLLGQFAQQAEQRKQRQLQEEMQRQQMEARQMEMEQMRRQQGRQEQMDRLAQTSFAPNQNLVHGDDEGNAMPSSGGGGLPAFAQGLMGMGYEPAMKGLALQQQIASQNQPDLVSVAPGATMYDKRAQKPVFQAPEKTPDWKDPAYQDFMMKKAAAGASRVSVDNRQENEFNKKIGAQFAENYNGILTSGMSAQAKLNDINRFENIMTKVPTGKLEPFKAEVGKLASSLGVKVDTEKLGFQEALDSLSNQFALTLRNPASGAGMPGALSDKDREFLVSMVPGLSKTPGGNKLVLEAFRRVAQREMEVAKLARAYKQQTGKFDEGFYEVLSREFGGKDLLGDLSAEGLRRGGGQTYRFDANGNPI